MSGWQAHDWGGRSDYEMDGWEEAQAKVPEMSCTVLCDDYSSSFLPFPNRVDSWGLQCTMALALR